MERYASIDESRAARLALLAHEALPCIVALACAFILSLALSGCSGSTPAADVTAKDASQKPVVLTTFTVIQDLSLIHI